MRDASILEAERFVQAVGDFVFVKDEPAEADVIFIPGASTPVHALHAAELYHQGFAPLLLPSGRYAKNDGCFRGVDPCWRAKYPGAYESEWAFLKAVLCEEGVPESAVLREDQATFTWENARLSRDVLEKTGVSVRRAIVCCQPSHARRALLYYQAAFPQARLLACPPQMPGLNRDDWFLTAEGRTRVLGELQRLGGQLGETLDRLLDSLTEKERYEK